MNTLSQEKRKENITEIKAYRDLVDLLQTISKGGCNFGPALEYHGFKSTSIHVAVSEGYLAEDLRWSYAHKSFTPYYYLSGKGEVFLKTLH
jgi:hypothetical protein